MSNQPNLPLRDFLINEQPVSTAEAAPVLDIRTHDLTGQRFGRLLVLSPAPKQGNATAWNCVCDCGTECVKIGQLMKKGTAKSCGCYRRERIRKANVVHGMAHTSEHEIWMGMNRRCGSPNCDSYPRYGGRGITVCERWRESFENFISDMGARPSCEHSLERKDNNGPYSPENCIWATAKTQSRNKRTSKIVEFCGVSRCLAEWAEVTGLPMYVLSKRLKAGWSVERALTEPLNVDKQHPMPRNGV